MVQKIITSPAKRGELEEILDGRLWEICKMGMHISQTELVAEVAKESLRKNEQDVAPSFEATNSRKASVKKILRKYYDQGILEHNILVTEDGRRKIEKKRGVLPDTNEALIQIRTAYTTEHKENLSEGSGNFQIDIWNSIRELIKDEEKKVSNQSINFITGHILLGNPYDLIFHVSYQDNIALANFVTAKLRTLNGVAETLTNTCIIPRKLKKMTEASRTETDG